MNRYRVLLIAEAANPEWVSVPLVGWSHARALAGVADVHLVTQVRNRDAILRAGLVEGRQFTAIDSEALAAPLTRLGQRLAGGQGKGWTTRSAFAALSYPYFEHLVWTTFGRQIRAGAFDLVHRLTPLSPTSVSPLAARCRAAGVPFVFGPLNGGVPWPRAFDRARRQEREWLSYVREAHKLLPGYWAMRRAASAILIGSRDTWWQMPRQYHAKCVYIPENGIDPQRFVVRRTRRAGCPITAVFLGRLVPYKGADMLVDAAAPLIKTGRVRLDIIGDGPLMGELRSRIAQDQLAGGVQLRGWVSHEHVQQHLADADVLAFPSIREFGGAVALEAMAVGLVPIVIDYGGPAELVTPQTGFLVPIGTRQQIIERLRSLLEGLTMDPGAIDRKSASALRRVQTCFTWQAKARQVLGVYRWVLGEAPKPDYGMPLRDGAWVGPVQ